MPGPPGTPDRARTAGSSQTRGLARRPRGRWNRFEPGRPRRADARIEPDRPNRPSDSNRHPPHIDRTSHHFSPSPASPPHEPRPSRNGLRQPQRSRSSGMSIHGTRRLGLPRAFRCRTARSCRTRSARTHRVLRRKDHCPAPGPLTTLPSSDLGARRHRHDRRRCCRLHSRQLPSRSCGGATSARPGPLDSSQGSAIRLSIRERCATSTRSSRMPQPGRAPLGLRSFTSMSPDHLCPAPAADRTRATCKPS